VVVSVKSCWSRSSWRCTLECLSLDSGLLEAPVYSPFLPHLPMAHAHYDTYREQLAGLYHGYALWDPGPGGLYDQVRVGDVGFILHGNFIRFFNALLAADHPNQGYDLPPNFVPLSMGPFPNIRMLHLTPGDYCSSNVTTSRDAIGAQIQAAYVTDRKALRSFFSYQRTAPSAHQTKFRMLHLNVEEARAPSFLFPSTPIVRMQSVQRSLRHTSVGTAIAGTSSRSWVVTTSSWRTSSSSRVVT
jgi:hypothetical protein